jgi:glycosyltransferase involved in cell wall biosynthesis
VFRRIQEYHTRRNSCYNQPVSTRSGSTRHVGLNAHLLSLTQSYRGAGINGYIHQLLRHLPGALDGGRPEPGDLAFTAFMYDPSFMAPPGLDVVRSRWDTRSPLRRILWEQTYLAAVSRTLNLIHGLAFAAPIASSCPTVVTVHDLSFLRFPSAFRTANRSYLSSITKASTRRAARVIAVSDSTRQDVINLIGVPAERVVVVPNGVNPEFSPADPGDLSEFRQRQGLPTRYILFLGTLEPRKNLVRLVEAYALLRSRAQDGAAATIPPLVIAGGKGWFYREIFARVNDLGLGDQVIFPGFLPAEDLPWWYRGAELFVYPSLFEGFGLPVLEAMACGTPTIASRASSLPEVAGDGAILVDPEDVGQLADAMFRVLTTPSLSGQLSAAGLRQAACFPWERTAAATREVYRSVLGTPQWGGGG